MQITKGYTWEDAKGRTWEVMEKLPFGRLRVRTADRSRVGEIREIDLLQELNQSASPALGDGGSVI